MIPFFFTESGSYFIFLDIMEFEVHGGQITKIYHGLFYIMHYVIKTYRDFSLHVSKWTQYYMFLNLTRMKLHITGEAWSNFSRSYEGFISNKIKPLHQHKSQ